MFNAFWWGNPTSVGQQTLAAQSIIAGAGRLRMTRTKRRRKASRKTAARRSRSSPAKRARRRNGRPARLVKGSAAAKRYMASIRRKRKR